VENRKEWEGVEKSGMKCDFSQTSEPFSGWRGSGKEWDGVIRRGIFLKGLDKVGTSQFTTEKNRRSTA